MNKTQLLSETAAKPGAETGRAYRRTVFDAICVAILIAYFLHFALPALRGGFREDEMMNMGICWCAGALKSLLANVAFWKLFVCPGGALYDLPLYLYRPAGAFYYLPLYHFFDLDPLPYRIVQISILASSIPLIYYLSRRLTSAGSIAFLAVLALCYHPRLAGLVFVGAFIYDVLCGFFYFAALAYYIHFREKGVSLRPVQLFGFLAIYVMALNCKEIAVTLPVIVLIYEFLKSHGWADWKALLRWISSYTAPSLIAGLLTVFYIYGKLHGTGTLTSLDPYRPKYSWDTFRRVASRGFGIVAMLLVAFALAAFTQRENQRLRVPWLNVGAKTSHVIHTFRSLALRPSHGSSILLLLKENLFQNKWNVFFIASLYWTDHSLRICVENVNELTPQQ